MKPLPDEVREALRERLREFEPYANSRSTSAAIAAASTCDHENRYARVEREVVARGKARASEPRNGDPPVTISKRVHKKPVQFVVRAWLEGSHLAEGEKIPAIPDWSTTFRFCVKCFEAAK